jgi:hypothetical protein
VKRRLKIPFRKKINGKIRPGNAKNELLRAVTSKNEDGERNAQVESRPVITPKKYDGERNAEVGSRRVVTPKDDSEQNAKDRSRQAIPPIKEQEQKPEAGTTTALALTLLQNSPLPTSAAHIQQLQKFLEGATGAVRLNCPRPQKKSAKPKEEEKRAYRSSAGIERGELQLHASHARAGTSNSLSVPVNTPITNKAELYTPPHSSPGLGYLERFRIIHDMSNSNPPQPIPFAS